MRKLTQNDVGKFVTVYFIDEGKQDGILLDLLGEDDCRVWFPQTPRTEGGWGSQSIVEVGQIVAKGPLVEIKFPKF